MRKYSIRRSNQLSTGREKTNEFARQQVGKLGRKDLQKKVVYC